MIRNGSEKFCGVFKCFVLKPTFELFGDQVGNGIFRRFVFVFADVCNWNDQAFEAVILAEMVVRNSIEFLH